MDSIKIPNLDRLAQSGTVFNHAYNMGAWGGAVCVTSRTMFNTGRFIWNAQNYDNATAGNAEINAGRFWSKQLKAAGYKTYFTGKWHLAANVNLAFDVTGTERIGMAPTVTAAYDRPLNPTNPWDTWSPYDQSLGGHWSGGKHWAEVLADETVTFLNQAAVDTTPFFIYAAFNSPHDPRQSPKSYVDQYPWQQVTVPVNFLTEHPYKDSIGCGVSLRDENLAPFPRTGYSIQVHRQEYYAMISHMDAQVGRILDALQSSGKAANTYVFFGSDNGLSVGHHGLMGKQSMYEHSMSVPLIVSGPGLPRGAYKDARVYLQDIMATTLELAGIPKPSYVEFQSLMPLLRGTAVKSYDAIYGAYMDLQRMVIEGDYKLIYYPHYPACNRAELFNLRADPMEMNNLAADSNYAAVLYALSERLKSQQIVMNDPLQLNYTLQDPTRFGTVDDAQLSDVTYTGSWSHISRAESYKCTISYSSAAATSAQIAFSGTGVKLYSQQGVGSGIYDIFIDGIKVGTFDGYAASQQNQVLALDRQNLASGQHTIRIVNTGTKNPAATGTNMHLDYIAYTLTPVGMGGRSRGGKTSLSMGQKQNFRVYRLDGTVVREYGSVNLNGLPRWDGRDARGNPVERGIYLTRFCDPDHCVTGKARVVK